LEVRPGPEMLLHVGIEHALLLQIVRHGVLRQKGCLQSDFGADPFTFRMGLVRRMVATPTTSELGTKVGVLDLIEVANLPPGLITGRARDIDFKPDDGHATPGARVLLPRDYSTTACRCVPQLSCAGTTGTA
jgi:hypothetical protein